MYVEKKNYQHFKCKHFVKKELIANNKERGPCMYLYFSFLLSLISILIKGLCLYQEGKLIIFSLLHNKAVWFLILHLSMFYLMGFHFTGENSWLIIQIHLLDIILGHPINNAFFYKLLLFFNLKINKILFF